MQARLREPQDDLPGALAQIYQQGDQTLTPDEIAALVYGQLTAGHETTTALLSNGLKELLGEAPVDPLPGKLRDLAPKGRIGAVVTRLDLSPDLASVAAHLS